METMSEHSLKKVHQSWLLLKITYGLFFIAAGVDKYLNMLTTWQKYVSFEVLKMIALPIAHILTAVSIFEIAIGILILSKWTRLGAYCGFIWISVMVTNLLLLGGYLDIIARDLVMAAGLIALALLT